MKGIPSRILSAGLLSCWNWKCALMSAAVRSLIYLLAMLQSGGHGSLAVVAVEMVYVTTTAGLWAGLQQQALALRQTWLGNLAIVVAVPGLSQLCDFYTHCLAGAVAPPRATCTVWGFTLLSALFHLHVMRKGAFLTGHGRSLLSDFRRMPRLLAAFAMTPFTWIAMPLLRLFRAGERAAA